MTHFLYQIDTYTTKPMQKILIWSKQDSLIQLISGQFPQMKIFASDNVDKIYQYAQHQLFDLLIADFGQSNCQTALELIGYFNQSSYSTRSLVICQYLTHSNERAGIYQAGGSDMISHPFSPIELKQHISNLLRLEKVYPDHTLAVGPVRLNAETGTLLIESRPPKPLRRKENQILACLIRHRPNVVTKTMLIDYVWGNVSKLPTESTLDVYIRRLRIHLGEFHNLIKTSRGFGYYFAQN